MPSQLYACLAHWLANRIITSSAPHSRIRSTPPEPTWIRPPRFYEPGLGHYYPHVPGLGSTVPHIPKWNPCCLYPPGLDPMQWHHLHLAPDWAPPPSHIQIEPMMPLLDPKSGPTMPFVSKSCPLICPSPYSFLGPDSSVPPSPFPLFWLSVQDVRVQEDIRTMWEGLKVVTLEILEVPKLLY